MRIAHVSDCYMPRLGGIERQVHDLALHQVAAGHDVEIITSVAGDPADDDPALRVHRPPIARGKRGTIQYNRWLAGGPILRAGNYDVIHAHWSTWSPMAEMSMWFAARAGIPVVVTVHSLWNQYWPIFSASNRVLNWNGLPVVWSAVSSVAGRPVANHLRFGGSGGRRDPVEVLPNAVDAAAWQVAHRPHDPDRVVIASVMRLAVRKRPDQYLRMLREVRAQVPDTIRLEAVIYGDGPRRRTLERYRSRHGMTWVRFHGAATHDEIREGYRDADLFVAPATLESFGIAALEARCAGLPVIAHERSGIRDFVGHEREGLLASGDADMVRQIVRLAISPGLRADIAHYNRSHTPSQGWDQVLAECERLYRRAGYRPADGPVPNRLDAASPDGLAQQSA